ncbi:zinc finger protein 658B [Eurytemora carolleeae]|uniref:zinc finger protein 658B n=1 Tax=Eurytemora carolleeae TaxID=1294199 RepID=UPI000C75C095|nr:zinc finger protein 658B [Eurytemora carolleeae]|eukprot:XP_023345692.1 zinc finger protein 658B-like [Eurytemora affinis]
MKTGEDDLADVLKCLEIDKYCVNKLTSSTSTSTLFKINRAEIDLHEFSSSVFLMLQVYQDLNEDKKIKGTFLTSNEEILEEVELGTLLNLESSFILNYIRERIGLQLSVCPGIQETNVINLDINTRETVIEKYGTYFIYRSRMCSRVVENGNRGELCPGCQIWIQNNIELGYQVKSEPKRNTNKRKEKEEEHEELDAENELSLNDEDQLFDPSVKLENDSKENGVLNNASALLSTKRCEKCDLKFKTLQELYTHLSVCEPSSVFYPCSQCTFVFPSEAKLKTHDRSHDEEIAKKCPIEQCQKMFKIQLGKSMRNHLRNLHKINPDCLPEDLKTKIEMDNLRVKGRRFHPCDFPGCIYVGKDITALRYHRPVHTGEALFCCTTCGKRFRYKKELFLCEKRHKGEYDYFCVNCDKKFLSKKKLDLHVMVHTGEKPFSCPICYFRCSRKDNLNSHIKKHHGMTWREAEQQTGSSINQTNRTHIASSQDKRPHVQIVQLNEISFQP